jgi:Calcineurin-like phosphoesterase
MRGALIAVLIAVGLVLGGGTPPLAARADDGARPFLPVLAYYYLWFDPSSWNRAKTDYPLLGRYSSDDTAVMRTQVQMAKAAGIDGFIVSWKSTEVNNRRLRLLIEVARAEDFHLALIYQGLDFDRNPQPADRVAAELRLFRDTFARDPVFHILGRPLLIWSGTWKFSRDQVAAAVAPIRADVQVLASEKDLDGYARIADLVEGNAYYWSSVDPTTDVAFAARLSAMGEAVHRRGGLWLAPFAPGFDARLIGGTRAVDRRDGATLREEYGAAVRSSPDVLGLISWNEFSENTYVEPSERYGNRYLDVLSELAASPVAAAGELTQDSSDPASGDEGPGSPATPLLALGGAAVLVGIVVGAIGLRRRFVRRAGRHASRPSRVPVTVLVVVTAVVLGGAAVVALRGPPAATPSPSVPPGAPTARYTGVKPAADPDHVVVAAAGDIACAADAAGLGDEEANSATSCAMRATADLVGALRPDAVLTLGDTQYPDGSLSRFLAGYDHTWGAFKPITYPVVGNHEYGTSGAAGYFDYFGAAAGDRDAGYYSYDLGRWHVVALNSECGHVGGCGAGSPQERWLLADLAAHPAACTLAYWHRPRFSSGTHGGDPASTALWSDLTAAGADLVLSGHDHDYERFAPLDPAGRPDPTGPREFVVGTGGDSFYDLHAPTPGHEAGIADTPGVLGLTLRADGYDWAFHRTGSPGVGDSGSASCHRKGPGAG